VVVDPGGARESTMEAAVSKRTRRTPLLCRLNMHHKWVRHFNPDAADYLHCTACGKDLYDGFNGERHYPDLLSGWGGGGVAGGG
jgi:hypothetical protein